MFVQLGDYKYYAETLKPQWSVGDFMTFKFFYYPILGLALSLILMPLLLGYFPLLVKFLGA